MIKKSEHFKPNYEIERRFMLNELPDVEFDEIKDIIQYYGVDSVGNFRIRIESSMLSTSINYYITRKKYVSEGVNEEDEHSLTKIEFYNLKPSTNSHISKIRHILHVGNLKWECDEFIDYKSPSDFTKFVAEVELPSIDYKFDIPEEIKAVLISEITNRKDLSNFSISTKN